MLGHQLGSDLCEWLPQAREFARHGYRVLVPVVLVGSSMGHGGACGGDRIRPPVAGVVSLSGASGFGGVEAEAASSPATPDADRLRTEQWCIRGERTAGDATPDVLEGAPDADRDVQGRDGDGLRGRRLVAQGRRDQAVEVFMTEAIGMPAEYLEPMKADRSWEKMTRYAHTLAYDGRIVQGTRDGAPLPPDRWSVTRPTEVAVGEGSPAAR